MGNEKLFLEELRTLRAQLVATLRRVNNLLVKMEAETIPSAAAPQMAKPKKKRRNLKQIRREEAREWFIKHP